MIGNNKTTWILGMLCLLLAGTAGFAFYLKERAMKRGAYDSFSYDQEIRNLIAQFDSVTESKGDTSNEKTNRAVEVEKAGPTTGEIVDTSLEIDDPEKPRGVKALFEYSQLVHSLKTEPDDKGRFLKVEIYNTDFKYPLIRVAEQWNSETKMASRSVMVADHVIVKWQEDADPDEIIQSLEDAQAEIREFEPEANFALISFDGLDPRAMGRILNKLKSDPTIKSVEPDYLASNDPHAFK